MGSAFNERHSLTRFVRFYKHHASLEYLYDIEYRAVPTSNESQTAATTTSNISMIVDDEDDETGFERFLNKGSSSASVSASDLERYLADPIFQNAPEDFNVLEWWKVNQAMYPSLANMARDIFAVLASTVASEAVSSLSLFGGGVCKANLISISYCRRSVLVDGS